MNSFDILHHASDAILTVGAALYLFSSFSVQKRSSPKTALIFIFSVAVYFSKLIYDSTVFGAVLSVSAILASSFAYRVRWYNRVFYVCLIYSLSVLCYNLAIVLILRIYEINVSLISTPELTYMSLIWARTMLFIFAVAIRLLKELIFGWIPHVRLWIVLLAPISAILSTFLQLRMYMLSLWAYSDVFLIAWVTHSIFILITVIMFNTVEKLKKSAEAEARLELIDKLVTQQETRYRELEEHGNSILKIKHDQKNFLIGVLSDLKAGNYADIEACVIRELSTVESAEFPMGRSDSVIYLLISSKSELAKNFGIKLETELHDIKKIKTSSIDFAVLLGNALDNAIEASKKAPCSDLKYISLMIKVEEGQIVVILKNYAPRNTDINALRSDKKSEHHGFGILSMKSIVDQYDGELYFDMEGDVFSTYITLNNRKLIAE